MAIIEPMDLVLRLKFDAAILEHVAKKATSKRAKAEARRRAKELRDEAQSLELVRSATSLPGNDESGETAHNPISTLTWA